MPWEKLILVFVAFQVLFDIVVVVLLFSVASRRRLEQRDLERVLSVEERLRALIEDKSREMSALQDAVVYERDRAVQELKRMELEIERKLKLLADAVNRKEEERRKKRELVRHLLARGKTPQEVAAELEIPISEVKLIAELSGKLAS